MDIQQLYDDLAQKIQLAEIYLEDGAPNSAARCLDEAAEICRQIAKERDKILSELMASDERAQQ